jgi:hypothetical protein
MGSVLERVCNVSEADLFNLLCNAYSQEAKLQCLSAASFIHADERSVLTGSVPNSTHVYDQYKVPRMLF